MTPHEFTTKWRAGGDERRDWHSFFDDLCRLVGHKTPREADPDHTWFTYEYGVGKAAGGQGWADAWKKGYFGWEAKGTGKDLQRAYAQLKMYADDLQNPPLLIVCDLQKFEIHTNFTNCVKEVHRFSVEDLTQEEPRRLLRNVFNNPEALRPGTTRSEITASAAQKFADLAQALRGRGEDAHTVAHFLNRLLFCMFAEDIGLLPDSLFTRMVEGSQDDPTAFESNAQQLFAAMHRGGQAGFTRVDWFNGGLFDHDQALRLEKEELRTLLAACLLDWSQIDPSIFGTLFERGLDPEKRAQLGANYTDAATIMKLIRPVIIEPWLAEWGAQKQVITPLMERADMHGDHRGESSAKKAARTRAFTQASEKLVAFLERLRAFTVLDPACGSGNFLFMSLRALKDVEQRVLVEGEELGLPRQMPGVGPSQIKGIEINDYAAELARITVWIGELQWMIQNGYGARKNPILLPLDQIEKRDALLNSDGTEASWPPADVIVGNPPFIGGSVMRGELGDAYVDAVRATYEGRVPGGADFVCYWFEKANDALRVGTTQRTGFVATNSIRGGANREVLKHAVAQSRLFEAWGDEPWTNEGAAVRVSLVCFGHSQQPAKLDGVAVAEIYADLNARGVGAGAWDLTLAKPLPTNQGVSFQGSSKKASFDIPGQVARSWLSQPNPNGKPNSDVVRPWSNGLMLSGRASDIWIIDFGVDMAEVDASLYELPFQYSFEHVRPEREKNNREAYRKYWWRHAEARPSLRRAIKPLTRYIATIAHSKHRFFVWLPIATCPDQALIVIARDDDAIFGILHSRLHELWALRMGTSLEDRPRYTPTTTFETFPFPEGITPNMPATAYADNHQAEAIASAARLLVEARDRWLNPAEWVDWQRTAEEAAAGFPLRPVAKPGHEAALKKRTLIKLYNERPAWLDNLHRALDEAVATAYGWEWPMSDDEILRRLFEMNQARTAGNVEASVVNAAEN